MNMSRHRLAVFAAILSGLFAGVPALGVNRDFEYYDIFAGDPFYVLRWTKDAYYVVTRNVAVIEAGYLPPSISYQTSGGGTDYGSRWSGTYYGVALTPSAVKWTHNLLLTYDYYISLYGLWIQATIPYSSVFRVDDYANGPADTNHLGTLTVQTEWSENGGWVDGHLHAEESLGNDNYLPADVDVFRVDTDAGVYCVETDKQLVDFDSALIIAVFKKKSDESEYNGEYIARTNKFNVYGDSGNINLTHQRVYFTLDNDDGAYVQLRLADPSIASNYKVRVFRARPLILVHGINAPPTESGPNNPQDSKTSFGDMRDYLGYLAEITPCVCYDFPWWSKFPDQRGFLYYVGQNKLDTASLYGFLYEKIDLHNNYPANIILHSMGGFLVRHSLSYGPFADLVHRVVFIDSPQYGSDLANFMDRNPGLNSIVNILPTLDTSNVNMLHLCRGGNTVWNMHDLDLNIPADHLSFVVGTDKGWYARLIAAMPKIDAKWPGFDRNNYRTGLYDSDGIVPVTSQNLRSREPNIPDENVIEMPKCHTGVQAIELNNIGASRPLYDLIKQQMNTE